MRLCSVLLLAALWGCQAVPQPAPGSLEHIKQQKEAGVVAAMCHSYLSDHRSVCRNRVDKCGSYVRYKGKRYSCDTF